jgi:hypothetical protein
MVQSSRYKEKGKKLKNKIRTYAIKNIWNKIWIAKKREKSNKKSIKKSDIK